MCLRRGDNTYVNGVKGADGTDNLLVELRNDQAIDTWLGLSSSDD